MEETIKKRRGRPPKNGVCAQPRKKKKENRGGARPGAGRKPIANARTKHFSFRVSERAVNLSNQLREAMKGDDMGFVDLLERWIDDLAKDYGIE